MARVNKGSHSFTCHPYVYLQVEWTIQVCLYCPATSPTSNQLCHYATPKMNIACINRDASLTS